MPLASRVLHPWLMKRIAKILLPIGIAGAGATGAWWLAEGGPNYGPPIVYVAFSFWVLVVLSSLAMLKLSRTRA